MIFTLLALLSCGGSPSEPIEAVTYAASAPRVAAPTYSPAAGTYTGTQSVTVRTSSTGAAIYCTTDGSRPRRSVGLRYSTPLSVSTSQTVRCLAATLDGRDSSRIASAAYVINSEAPLVGWAATCAAEPFPASGTIYVCDCQAGADANCVAGSDTSPTPTNPATPLRTWVEARNRWMNLPVGGGTVALCKGGKFDASSVGGSYWLNYNCTPSQPCTLRDYDPRCAGPGCVNVWGSGDEGRPIVTTTGDALKMGGSSLSDGYRFLNLELVGPGGSGDGFTCGDNNSDITVCNMVIRNFAMAIYVDLNNCTGAGGYRHHYLGNQILHNSNMGAMVDISDSEFDGNVFDDNSFGLDPFQPGATTHSFYFAGWCGSSGFKFINNKVSRNQMWGGYAHGSPINFNGSSTGSVIENNWVDASPHDVLDNGSGGIFAWNSYGATMRNGAPMFGHRNLVVRRNRVTGGTHTSIGISDAQNVLVEDNIVVQDGGADASYNPAIGVPHKDVSGGDLTTGAVRNNTVYLTNASNASSKVGINVASGASTTGFVVTGNAVVFGNNPGPYPTSCFGVGNAARISYFDANLCYGATSVGYGSPITAAPQFRNAPTDLTPCLTGDAGCSGTSPLIGAASTATCTVQGAGQPCSSTVAIDSPTWSPTATAKPRDGAPDIGAMER